MITPMIRLVGLYTEPREVQVQTGKEHLVGPKVMIRTILEEVKAKGFEINLIIMDHNASGGNIACSVFLEVRITYCGNHNAKTFHHDLMKIKSVRCKVKHKLCNYI